MMSSDWRANDEQNATISKPDEWGNGDYGVDVVDEQPRRKWDSEPVKQQLESEVERNGIRD